MRTTAKASNELIQRLHATITRESARQVAKRAGVHHGTIANALQGKPIHADALERLSKIIPKTRSAGEFKASRGLDWKPPIQKDASLSWPLEKIRAARDAQMRGEFDQPARLAEAMRTDDAIYVAYQNRIAPQAAIAAKLVACEGARGEAVRRKAAASVTVERSVLAGIQGTMANHGLAIGYARHDVNSTGTIVSMRLEEWPLEAVRWNPSREVLETSTREMSRVDIVHGDSHWLVFAKFKIKPWTQAACLLPASMVWASHANGVADWAGGSKAHGLSQIMGALPDDFALEDEDGALTKDAQAFLDLMTALANGDTRAALAPPGFDAKFLANSSTAWQIFAELIQNREKAAARIYQGTDAALGSVGGAPGVDIAALFGVATTILQGDFGAIETALKTGLYDPWTAINEGDSRYAPRLEYQMPDPDADAKHAQSAAGRTRLATAIKEMRDQKFEITQADVDLLAKELGVHPAPRLASIDKQTATIQLAPTDVAKVVRVREARASQGLPPFGDERDDMTITQLDATIQQKADIAVDTATAPDATAAPAVPT